jgi:hypothetical protein
MRPRHAFFLPLFLLLLLAAAGPTSQPASQPDSTVTPLVYLQKGDIPLILSAPHGGTLAVPGVSRRTGEHVPARRGEKPNFSIAFDRNVDKLALAVAEEIFRRTGKRPYVVIANFSRKFVDANRPPEDAYESDTAAPVYDAYHQALRDYRTDILKTWKAGFLLDLHGHGLDPALIIRGSANWSSVRHLVEEFGKDALTGPTGLLAPLEAAGNKIEPPNADNETLENKSLNGGYITRHYGSFEGSNFDALQLELGGSFRNPSRIPTFAKELTDSLLPFLGRYIYPRTSEPQDDADAHPTTRP